MRFSGFTVLQYLLLSGLVWKTVEHQLKPMSALGPLEQLETHLFYDIHITFEPNVVCMNLSSFVDHPIVLYYYPISFFKYFPTSIKNQFHYKYSPLPMSTLPQPLLETFLLSQYFSSLPSPSLEKYFYTGYLFAKYSLTLHSDLPLVLSLLDRLNNLLITTKQKNSILQKLSSHDVTQPTVENMEKVVFEYVDEVVPHLQMAVELERMRKESQMMNQKDVGFASEGGNKLDCRQKGECGICLEVMGIGGFVLECSHEFHRECVTRSFETKIDENVLQLRCPEATCLKEIPSENAFNYLTPKYQTRYQSFMFKKYVSDNYETMCWCPTIGCEYVFCFQPGESTFICPVCSKFYCLKCRSEYHIGMSCREYSRSKDIPEDDEKFYQFAEGARYKQCPKCKFWVERSEGCHHIVCRCQFEFCYVCGEEYPNCGCDTEEQAERAELALQIAAEQLRVISEGLQQHQRQLLRIQRLEEIEGQREFTSPFISPFLAPSPAPVPNSLSENNLEQKQLQLEPAPLRNQSQFSRQPETLTTYRKFQSRQAPKNPLSTSQQSLPKHPPLAPKFQMIKQQNRIPPHKTFYGSPESRKIFKSGSLFPIPSHNRYFHYQNKSLKSKRFENQKSFLSLEKSLRFRPEEPISHPHHPHRKLTFTDLSERKKSQTKY